MKRVEVGWRVGRRISSLLFYVFSLVYLTFMWAILGLVLIIGLIYVYRYVTVGYCPEQNRFLSDSEYLHMRLEDLMKSSLMELGPSDTSAEAYLVNHPDCCWVKRKRRDLFETVMNTSPIVVVVNYEMSVAGQSMENGQEYYRNGGKETYFVDIQDMSSCGKYGEWAGTTDTPPEPKVIPVPKQ